MSSDIAATLEALAVPTTPYIDTALLRKALEWAEEEHAKEERGERSEYDQCSWYWTREGCGTTMCIAGRICILNEDEEITLERFRYFADDENEDWQPSDWDGLIEHQHWAFRAADLLGVPSEATAGLFYGMNNIQAVRIRAEMLVGLYGMEGERL